MAKPPHADLRDRRPGRRAGDPPVEDVDEEDLQHEVGDVRRDHDLQRPAQVGDAAEIPLPGLPDARKIHELMEEIVSHTHNLAHQFGSLDVKGDDLATVLKALSENVKKMFQIPCELSTKGQAPELPQHTTIQLYKIAQEAVSNAIKHGKATRVLISAVRHNDELVLCIKNDGIPFAPPANAKDRMGLRIMNYRANTIGATLDIQPQEKGGTVVMCSLPLKNKGVIALRGHARAKGGQREMEAAV